MYDLAIIGGGINGCGIARDAAGRGLKVVLLEQNDLASATSGWSSKLIHGGLRYLEQYAFRLVRESLQEREKLLAIAPHLITPLTFAIPHVPSMRPAWMVRAGLFIYDHLGGTISLPKSYTQSLPDDRFDRALKPQFLRAFVYSDARVDDARLTILNAVSARNHGATIRPRERVVGATRHASHWTLYTKHNISGDESAVEAKVVINAAGPWVENVLHTVLRTSAKQTVRLVKGSHIVVPRVYAPSSDSSQPDHAYLCQNDDGRIVFILPFEEKYSLIGTTDVAVESIEDANHISREETQYLLSLANRFLRTRLTEQDIVWTYAGVRPLYDDGKANASKVTRDYVLVRDEDEGAPLLSVFGGKVTTYRHLAERAMNMIAKDFHNLHGAWTASEALPGGDLDGMSLDEYALMLHSKHVGIPPDYIRRLVGRYGSMTPQILRGVTRISDLGEIFGEGRFMLTEREVEHLIAHEWAMTPDDILWRRTKCALHMDAAERERFVQWMNEKKAQDA